jgi:hypothetical protein
MGQLHARFDGGMILRCATRLDLLVEWAPYEAGMYLNEGGTC